MTADSASRTNRLLLWAGVILAVAAFGGAFYYTKLAVSPVPAPVVTKGGASVVVAAVAIPSGTTITGTMLRKIKLQGPLPQDAFTSCVPLTGSVCGTVPSATVSSTKASYYAVVAIAPVTVITQDLISANKPTQAPPVAVPEVPPGDVAISIPLSGQEGVDGYLQAGDHIDIIAASANNVSFTFEDIPVLSAGPPEPTGTASSTSSSTAPDAIMLQVTRSQALGIEAMEEAGTLYSIALRPSSDFGHGYIPVTISPNDNYIQACTPGSTVNPVIEADLQQAQQTLSQASTAYDKAQKQLTSAQTQLPDASAGPRAIQAESLVLQDTSTVAQDQFALVEAQDNVTADQEVLYCGALAANSKSQSIGYADGNASMLQRLFGFVS